VVDNRHACEYKVDSHNMERGRSPAYSIWPWSRTRADGVLSYAERDGGRAGAGASRERPRLAVKEFTSGSVVTISESP
jgi:hypothetical protein